MHRFKFGGINAKGIYLDETVMRMCYTHRSIFVQLAVNLISEGDLKRAAEVLAYVDKNIPTYNVPVDFISGSIEEARAYAALGNNAKAINLAEQLWTKSQQYLNWYLSLDANRFAGSQRECLQHIYVLQNVAMLGQQVKPEWGEKMMNELNMMIEAYHNKGGRLELGS